MWHRCNASSACRIERAGARDKGACDAHAAGRSESKGSEREKGEALVVPDDVGDLQRALPAAAP